MIFVWTRSGFHTIRMLDQIWRVIWSERWKMKKRGRRHTRTRGRPEAAAGLDQGVGLDVDYVQGIPFITQIADRPIQCPFATLWEIHRHPYFPVFLHSFSLSLSRSLLPAVVLWRQEEEKRGKVLRGNSVRLKCVHFTITNIGFVFWIGIHVSSRYSSSLAISLKVQFGQLFLLLQARFKGTKTIWIVYFVFAGKLIS